VIRYCRVGILNEIGELLAPKVAILLIGERPGLATAESLSAYMAYQPKHRTPTPIATSSRIFTLAVWAQSKPPSEF
jgi:ethanolamine ammonia-lyase small subunit